MQRCLLLSKGFAFWLLLPGVCSAGPYVFEKSHETRTKFLRKGAESLDSEAVIAFVEGQVRRIKTAQEEEEKTLNQIEWIQERLRVLTEDYQTKCVLVEGFKKEFLQRSTEENLGDACLKPPLEDDWERQFLDLEKRMKRLRIA